MHKLLKGKWLFIWIGAVVLIAVGVVLFLGIKSVEVDSDLSVRLIFGKMGENDSHRVLTRAEEYLKGDNFATCRRLANFVVAHGGKYADDGLLLVASASALASLNASDLSTITFLLSKMYSTVRSCLPERVSSNCFFASGK